MGLDLASPANGFCCHPIRGVDPLYHAHGLGESLVRCDESVQADPRKDWTVLQNVSGVLHSIRMQLPKIFILIRRS